MLTYILNNQIWQSLFWMFHVGDEETQSIKSVMFVAFSLWSSSIKLWKNEEDITWFSIFVKFPYSCNSFGYRGYWSPWDYLVVTCGRNKNRIKVGWWAFRIWKSVKVACSFESNPLLAALISLYFFLSQIVCDVLATVTFISCSLSHSLLVN